MWGVEATKEVISGTTREGGEVSNAHTFARGRTRDSLEPALNELQRRPLLGEGSRPGRKWTHRPYRPQKTGIEFLVVYLGIPKRGLLVEGGEEERLMTYQVTINKPSKIPEKKTGGRSHTIIQKEYDMKESSLGVKKRCCSMGGSEAAGL